MNTYSYNNLTNYFLCVLCECVTDVVVGHPLQQAGLVAAGRRLDAGGQQAQVRLINVQREIRCGAQFDLRAALLVL